MRRTSAYFLCFLLLLFTWLSCSKSSGGGNNDPCAGITVAVTGTVTNAATGQSNGSIAVSATGGSGFTFSLNGGAFQSGTTFSNLAAGAYTITAKNSNGCQGSAQFTVGSTNLCAGVTVTVTATVTNAATGQSNGSIAAAATGGSGFTFSINGGVFQSSGLFSNLAAGNYTITAKNSNGCQGSAQFTVGTSNACAGVTINVSTAVVGAVPCGGSGGSITVTATGSAGFTYSLNSGAFGASNVFSNLTAGNYTVTAKDANGCTNSANAVVGTANAGPLFSAVRTIVQNNCAVAGCHVPGGTAPVNFTVDCNIVSSATNIKVRAVDQAGTSNQMPQPPRSALSSSDQQAIVAWLNAGGRFDN